LFITLGIRPVADFETLNYQIMTDLNTSTEAQNTTETAIGFIPCCTLADLTHQPTNEAEKIKNAKRGDLDLKYTVKSIENYECKEWLLKTSRNLPKPGPRI